jgi:hypothetical protein
VAGRVHFEGPPRPTGGRSRRFIGGSAFHERLLARIPGTEVVGRPSRRLRGALLDAVTTVLELAAVRLRVRQVHAAVEESYGERVAVVICERGAVHPSER